MTASEKRLTDKAFKTLGVPPEKNKMRGSPFSKEFFGPFLGIATLLTPTQVRAESYRPIESLWQGMREIPSEESAWVLGAGTLLTLAALSVDTKVKNYFSAQHPLGSASKFGSKFWGAGAPSLLLGIGNLAYGFARDRPREKHTGTAHLESLAVTVTATLFLKESLRRERPDSSNQKSFPSGHTSSSFSTAAVVWERDGPLWGAGAIALGAFTGLSRIAESRHHLSDVIFGGTLGWIVGHAYARRYTRKEGAQSAESASNWRYLPYYESRSEFGFIAEHLF